MYIDVYVNVYVYVNACCINRIWLISIISITIYLYKATLMRRSPTIHIELIDAHHMLFLVILLQDMCDDRGGVIIAAPNAYCILIFQYGQES